MHTITIKKPRSLSQNNLDKITEKHCNVILHVARNFIVIRAFEPADIVRTMSEINRTIKE